ncbi:hypothetical protein L6164_032498 [Bauhinia variegata]|uniref:Uncharacterized protein n=1 Tax=Bauhinia variegata TaxID=167791 RepID=A0ACB9KP34_BAUVA|nr:hypothetical protein L6164_032498 [Bauhinia variegata]
MEQLRSLNRSELLEVLSQCFCEHCELLLEDRITSLLKRKHESAYWEDGYDSASFTRRRVRRQWDSSCSHESVKRQRHSGYSHYSPRDFNSTNDYDFDLLLDDGLGQGPSVESGLSEKQIERIRYSQVQRKKDFKHVEMINGREINVLQGLELHTRVFNFEEQQKIIELCYQLQRKGREGRLRGRTYSEPKKWMRGKGRVKIQFGCCYNYATDKYGNPPCIMRSEKVDSIPYLFRQMIKRMVRWNIVPSTCIPNSCIINIYEPGDCIPPHIDHHDFVRPFCTVSLLSECDIVFGSELEIVGPGEFSGPVSIPLPVGSVLVLNGNGADIAKHCVPSVPTKRISITFRKMDDNKLPHEFRPDPELARIKPFTYTCPDSPVESRHSRFQLQKHNSAESGSMRKTRRHS